MMRLRPSTRAILPALAAVALGRAAPLAGQTAEPTPDAVIQAIVREAADSSHLVPLTRVLLDSIGPRLTGSPGERAARDWALARFRAWGVDAHDEAYGTWTAWRRGIAHLDLLRPRQRALSATLLAWSPGTRVPVQAEAVILPPVDSAADFARWLGDVRGKVVLVTPPPPSCRPDESWQRSATPQTLVRMEAERAAADSAWMRWRRKAGTSQQMLPLRLEAAGAAGVLSSRWAEGWGAQQVMNAWTLRVPMLDVACEDYTLLYRLASAGMKPAVRIDATADFLGEVPVHNTLATLPGSERPGEYVVLSAHLDSWDAAAGATDNGAGVLTVMEAMRILRKLHPHPRRTIVAALWGGEEEGLNGSGAWAADHPAMVRGIQALFNQDEGTGRIARIPVEGSTDAQAQLRRWLSRLPPDLAAGIALENSGEMDAGGSDHASFACRGTPAFNLLGVPWDYRPYTWHTDRDTYDKLSLDDLKANAALLAALAYLASEDPRRLPRAPTDARKCRTPARSMAEFLEHLLEHEGG
jgi:carboxypeptidase Q